MRRAIVCAALLLAPVPASAQKVTVAGGAKDMTNVVVSVPIHQDTAYNSIAVPGGSLAPAQVVPLRPPAEEKGSRLVFVLPELKAGKSYTLALRAVNHVKTPPRFKFQEAAGQHVDVLFDGRPVLRYVNMPHDPADHYFTFKPFHQVFDPATGKVMLSSGSYKGPKDAQFPHHRGLFFGFNKITYGDKKTADIWHGTNNVYSAHDKMLGMAAGEVLARHTAAISWHGPDGQTFANETRQVTVYNVPGGTLLDWESELTTELPRVRLDGDPQHAGFHFRATQEVSKTTAKQTYYLRPDGPGKLGETRNWDAKGRDPKTVNLPWNAMSFVTGGKRYTALRVNHPDNPGETRGSERDYGRFGDYFEYDLTPASPLRLKYRVWVQEGEMTVEQCAAIAAAFATPPQAKVAK